MSNKYKYFSFRFNKSMDSDIISTLENQNNITEYLRKLIRDNNIKKLNGIKAIKKRLNDEKLKLDFANWIVDENLDSLLYIEYFGFDVVMNDFIQNNGSITLKLGNNSQFMTDIENNANLEYDSLSVPNEYNQLSLEERAIIEEYRYNKKNEK